MRLPHLSNLAWLLLSLGLVAACGGGSNEGNSVTISATAGGSASSDDGLLTLEVPPGALEADTRISIQAVSNDDLPDDVAAGAEGAVAYRLEPDGLRFSKPVIATLRLDPEELVSADEEGAFEVPLLFLQSEGEIPEVLANLDFAVSLDDGLASISGEVEHFSWIKLVKGPMALVLQQHNESKALGQPFQVTFYIGGGPIKDLRVGDHHLAIYGPDLDVSGDADGVLQVPLLLVQSEGEIPELLANLDFAVSFDDGSASISGEVEHFSWIKSVKGSMQISLQQPDESKPLGLSFQVKFSVGRRIISEYRVGENVYISYGRSLSNISGSVIGSEQVVVFIVDGRPGTSFTGPPESHVADLICTQPGKGFYSVNARAEFELAVIGGSGSGKPPETAVVRATV